MAERKIGFRDRVEEVGVREDPLHKMTSVVGAGFAEGVDLLACLNDGPVAVQAMTIWALGEIGGPEARSALRSTLLGPSHQVRWLAAEALAALGPAGFDVLTEVAAGESTGRAAAARALSDRKCLEPTQA